MKFTYYSIIGKDLNLLKGHVENVKHYAGLDKIPNNEFVMIVYTNPKIPASVTQSILDYCKENNVRTHVYAEPDSNFITNLYACWNLGYEQARDGFVFRGGSDQVFSQDSFLHMYEAGKAMMHAFGSYWVLQAQSVENVRRVSDSRHFLKDFGENFEQMNLQAFESMIQDINNGVEKPLLSINECVDIWGKPTGFMSSLGMINRTDGLSWLMTKKAWEDYGPLPPIENGITGDVVIHDRMTLDGHPNFLVRDCVTYHFVRGESLAQYE